MPSKLSPEFSLSSLPSDSELTPITTPDNATELTEPTDKSVSSVTKTTTRKRTRKAPVKAEEDEDEEELERPMKARKRATKVTTKVEETVKVEDAGEDGEAEVVVKKKATRKRKLKVEEIEPLEPRTADTKINVGAHVSVSGGVHNAVWNSVHIGGNAFALFLKSQRKWAYNELEEEHITSFTSACSHHSISLDTCLPHGSYLVNLAHTDEDRTKQAYDSFLDDLTRCHRLGIKLYNFHPGNANNSTREEAIAHLASNLNRAHKDPSTGSVITLLETMATLGNTIGGTFEDLAATIALVDDKSRVGVCLDTCHVFAAGYDLRTPTAFAETLEKFDSIIGLQYLKALHVNDSKAPFASHRDLHARIGTGYLGLRAFHNLVNEPRLWGLPMILETPIDVEDAEGKKVEDRGVWAREIKMLESLVGMDVEGEVFRDLEEKLQLEGEKERVRVGEQVEKKRVKDEAKRVKGEGKKVKSVVKAKGKGKKKVEVVESESELSAEDEEEE